MCYIATEVEFSDISVQGILNSSPLSQIVGFNLVDSIPVNYMHVGQEGIVKRMMNCWFKKIPIILLPWIKVKIIANETETST